ncbi:MAG: DUF87 domain-containing protein [Spirochaetia bacterium]|nr:DUF87 domain-containing protein [Spirochaetia bacterium]
MAVLSSLGNRIKGGIVKVAQKGADALAKTAEYSPYQLEQIDSDRQKYLQEMPSSNDYEVQKLIERNLGAIGIEVYEAYLPVLKQSYTPVLSGKEDKDSEGNIIFKDYPFDSADRICYFDITRWVLDKEENFIDKLVNVYHVLYGEECNIALIFDRKVDSCSVKLAIVNNSESNQPGLAKEFSQRLLSAIAGNFPGVTFSDEEPEKNYKYGIPFGVIEKGENNKELWRFRELSEKEKNSKESSKIPSVSIISNVPAEKSEKFISQSMEKLLDGIVPVDKDGKDNYTIVLLATPVKDQLSKKNRLYEFYSLLKPYSEWQTNFTYSESSMVGDQATFGINIGASAGANVGNANTQGEHHDKSHQVTRDEHVSREAEQRYDKGDELVEEALEKVDKNGNVKLDIKGNVKHGKLSSRWRLVPIIGQVYRKFVPPVQVTKGKSESDGTVDGVNSSITKNQGAYAGANFGVNFSRSSSVSTQLGKNEGITQSFTNYNVTHTLQIIEEQMKRLEQCSALGMWDFASYVLSENPVISNNVAHMYLALTQGEKSYLSEASINNWNSNYDKEEAYAIVNSLKKLQHPIFALKDDIELDENSDYLMLPSVVDATTALSGKEVAWALNFPRKSVIGLPVLESVSFGREVHRYKKSDDKFEIGNIYHMRNVEKNKKVELDKQSITSHVFVTGSTGSGKSNTIYQLIKQINVSYLVIEPAKGDYKKIIGKDAAVFGTNPVLTNLLSINPFAFPKGIHVLEHIDRLVEIFNACWPMYAAMPAVLKDAIESCYIDKGWDLSSSICENYEFPTFFDLLNMLPKIMEDSLYSGDTKSDYEGALITRVKSLTNGINGQVLCSSKNIDKENKELFENNVIVDLSRVGSMETKSLIMGLLIMKQQEFYLAKSTGNDSHGEILKHITILEEAHNLLKKTSSVQTQESSNLQGKSVEMISNAIAEMRTYGEGFIIVDQAPGLLDEAVIRNTNTKIILRLPDENDRLLVGKSASLTDNQIKELAKLPQGVAAVYQNDWIEPVLCQFEKYESNNSYTPPDGNRFVEYRKKFFTKVFVSDTDELSEEIADYICNWYKTLHLSEYSNQLFEKVLSNEKLSENELEMFAYNVFKGKKMAGILENNAEEKRGIEKVESSVKSLYGINDDIITAIVVKKIFSAIFHNMQGSELVRRYSNIEKFGRVL